MIVKHDLKKLLEESTMIFENVPDLSGDTTAPDGGPRTWTVRPLTVAREHAVEKARLSNTAYLQKVIATNQRGWKAVEEGKVASEDDAATEDTEDVDPHAAAEQWAPIVAAMVCDPELDVDELIGNFHGVTLRFVGETAEAFFREGPELMKKNREQRRAQK